MRKHPLTIALSATPHVSGRVVHKSWIFNNLVINSFAFNLKYLYYASTYCLSNLSGKFINIFMNDYLIAYKKYLNSDLTWMSKWIQNSCIKLNSMKEKSKKRNWMSNMLNLSWHHDCNSSASKDLLYRKITCSKLLRKRVGYT